MASHRSGRSEGAGSPEIVPRWTYIMIRTEAVTDIPIRFYSFHLLYAKVIAQAHRRHLLPAGRMSLKSVNSSAGCAVTERDWVCPTTAAAAAAAAHWSACRSRANRRRPRPRKAQLDLPQPDAITRGQGPGCLHGLVVEESRPAPFEGLEEEARGATPQERWTSQSDASATAGLLICADNLMQLPVQFRKKVPLSKTWTVLAHHVAQTGVFLLALHTGRCHYWCAHP